MAYIKPAVQVYQELVNAGGAAALSPDMPACIIGPLTTVVDVNLADSISKIGSLGSISDDSQVDATFVETPDTEDDLKLYVNFTSAKSGQILDVESISVTAEDPLVKTYSFQPSASSVSDPIILTENLIGDTTAVASTPLPFYNTVNHVSLGDTVSVSGGIDTYVSAVDYVAGTITLNTPVEILGTETVTIYHKFGSLEVGAFEIDTTTGEISYDDTHPLEADANISGYGMFPEAEIESASTSPMKLYVGYSAKRADLSGRVLTINDTTDLIDQLGAISSSNPLALGVSLALANSGGTAIHAIAIDPRLAESVAHTQATELAQAQLIHKVVPLTQQLSIHATYLAHVKAMSLPESGKWRVAMTNCAIPTEDYLYGQPGSADGSDEDTYPDLLKAGTYDASTFTMVLPRGESAPTVYPGDYLQVITDVDAGTYVTSSPVTANSGSNIVLTSDTWYNQDGSAGTAPTADATTGFLYFYGAREATKQGQAEWVAAQASTWSSNRMWMFPGDVLVPNEDGLDEVLPGYYLMSALAGFISGTPAQQPITKITVAGVSDLVHGNFYFTEAQMNIMAEKGTLLYEQNAQGTTPYCRHGLTTDVSVLEYREILKVKNWDYLSYYYKSVLDPFIGTWNITPDTIQTIRQTVTSASESLLTRKLPKIGAPLLSYSIDKLGQSATSADSIDLVMKTAIVNPNNYTNVYLQI